MYDAPCIDRYQESINIVMSATTSVGIIMFDLMTDRAQYLSKSNWLSTIDFEGKTTTLVWITAVYCKILMIYASVEDMEDNVKLDANL